MFREARIKLTLWYVVVIMAVSIAISALFYKEGTADSIFYLNLGIFIFSAVSGYYLAGLTLDPIKRNLEEQKDFISNASHELRTPITSLKTEIEVALRDPATKNKRLLRSNLDDVNRMQKLTDYLLRFNRYEGDREVDMMKVDLRNVVRTAVKSFKYKFDLKLTKSLVMGNEDSLVELITILLDNAIKYSKRGGKVSISVKDGVITVKDKGIGISDEDLPHIFERFYRASPSGKGNMVLGYGLGLSIAKSIVDLHGGKIGVVSKPSQGTTFKIIL